MSAPTPPTGGPVETPPSDKEVTVTMEPVTPKDLEETPVKTFVIPPLLGLWIILAGLWKSGEVAWFILRGLARLIA